MDVIALSHAHEDHIGGLPALVDDFHPRSCGPAPPRTVPPGVRCAKASRQVPDRPHAIAARFAFGGAEIEVLAPLPDYIPGDTQE